MRFPTRLSFRASLCATTLLMLGSFSLSQMASAAPAISTLSPYSAEGTVIAPELSALFPADPNLEQSRLDPRRYKHLPPPYIPRNVTAEAWALPFNGFPLANLLTTATESCLIGESTDAISRVGRGHIPKNLRCARSVSYLLHLYVPQFHGHDWAETCARRIVNTLKAKRTRTYNLQEQLDGVPQGYLYVICLLSTPRSRVGHICFYDPETKGVIGNSMGVWKSQPLEHFWAKYRYYYLLGIPVRAPHVANETPDTPAPEPQTEISQ